MNKQNKFNYSGNFFNNQTLLCKESILFSKFKVKHYLLKQKQKQKTITKKKHYGKA